MGMVAVGLVVLGFLLGHVLRASSFPHLEAFVSWVRLHTILRGASIDVQTVAAMAGAPILITTAQNHAQVVGMMAMTVAGLRRRFRARA